MKKQEMIKGLKAGRELILDGWASAEERDAIADLQKDDLITAEFVETDQYSFYRIKWKNLPKVKPHIFAGNFEQARQYARDTLKLKRDGWHYVRQPRDLQGRLGGIVYFVGTFYERKEANVVCSMARLNKMAIEGWGA